VRHPRLLAAATLAGLAAALVAGYAAAGPSGLVDVAAVIALGVLVVARGVLRGPEPRTVRPHQSHGRSRAIRAADFPAYAKIASDLEWAQLSGRDYEHGLYPTLTRLAATLGRPGPASLADPDGPGVDLATLDRIVTELEEER